MNNKITIPGKIILYFFSIVFCLNLYLFFGLFTQILFPNLRFEGAWSYLALAITVALVFAVGKNLEKHGCMTIIGFNFIVAIVNAIAIWRQFYYQ